MTRILLAVLVCYMLVGVPSYAQEKKPQVVKLREDVTLAPVKGGKQLKFARDDFKVPWDIKGRAADGNYVVVVNDQQYSVPEHAVVVNMKCNTDEKRERKTIGATFGVSECK